MANPTNAIRAGGRDLRIGDEFYLCGSPTKVRIVDHPEKIYPTCEILELGKVSRYEVGQVVPIFNKILYPFRGKRGK